MAERGEGGEWTLQIFSEEQRQQTNDGGVVADDTKLLSLIFNINFEIYIIKFATIGHK